MFRWFAVAVFAAVLALGAASVASAHAGPSVTFFKSPLPVIGSQLPGTTGDSLIQMKDGWTMSSPGGLRSQRADPPPPAVRHVRAAPQAGSPWQVLAHSPPFNPGAMLLLTNGKVLVQDQGAENDGSGNWWLLTPDAAGSYVDGTWSQVASLPSGYAPLYFASAVLPDGRVIIMGGEYNEGKLAWTNRGAIYNPVANTWRAVHHPNGTEWVRIGDAPSTVLGNGTFMLGASGYSGTTAEALLNEAKLTWRATGTGKADGNGALSERTDAGQPRGGGRVSL